MKPQADYKSICERKRRERDARIPSEWKIKDSPSDSVIDVPATCGLLDARELEITNDNDAVDILQKIRTRQYTAEEVTRAFCKRAAITQQLTNCLTEIFFDQAIERAKELDTEQSNAGGTALRPLHGLPISLKDSFRVPGVDSSIGLVCFVNQPDDTYSALPKLLLDLGAVLYCKTNIPQTMMTADSDNNVFGRTLNPWNKRLTAGGSSGGEGALIAMRGSVLGVGTDIAGSIRIPSLCNGVYGFRPSANIIPFAGQRSPVRPGVPGIFPVAGPLATSLRACNYFMQTVVRVQPWQYDPMCVHQHWMNLSLKPKLRIGVVAEDGIHTPWPPVRRALSEAVEKLRKAGVELVPLTLPAMPEALATTWKLFGLDGGEFIQSLIAQGAEPLVQSVKNVNLAATHAADFSQLCDLIVSRAKIQAIYHRLWLENGLDALILPPAPTTATPLDQWVSVGYTALWNFLNWPAVVLPAGKVRASDVADGVETATHGEADRANYALYTGPVDFEDAPLAVQVVGMKQEDEELALIAQFVDEVIHA